MPTPDIDIGELRKLEKGATPGPWCVEDCASTKGDGGSYVVGVAFGPDDRDCERQLSGMIPDAGDAGNPIEYYREELVADCEITESRNAYYNAALIAALRNAAPALLAAAEAKDAAYHERDMLVCALSKCFPSYLARHSDEDKTWEDDWRWIVYIELPTGQASWHIHDSERELFNHLEVRENNWDGHNTERKYQRLAALQSVHLLASAENPDAP